MSPELGTNAVELLLKALSSFNWEPRELSDFVRQAAESLRTLTAQDSDLQEGRGLRSSYLQHCHDKAG